MTGRRVAGWRESLRGSLWALPSLSVGVSVVLGTALSEVRVALPAALEGVLFSGDAQAAQSLLGVVAGSIITVTSLVFSLTVLTLQIASSQYSPRLLRNFLQDRGTQWVLATFLSTFAYCLSVLRTVRSDDVPTLAVSVVLVFVLASLGMLVYVIHHIAHSIRLDTIMRSVERRVLSAIERNHPHVVTGAEWRTDLPDIPPHAQPVPGLRSGFLQTLDAEPLTGLLEQHDAVLRFVPMVGQQIVEGGVLAWVWGRNPGQRLDLPVLTKRANGVTRVGYERTLDQDVAFGIRQLVDVAVRGVSPAVNDPATTVEAIGHLSVAISRLAARRLGGRMLGGSGVTTRVAIPWRDFSGYLDLAISPIRRYGAFEPMVAVALLRLLEDAADHTTSTARHAVLSEHARMVVAEAERGIAEPGDLIPVQEAATAVRTAVDRAAAPPGQHPQDGPLGGPPIGPPPLGLPGHS